jgi:glycine/D-amino acid oxidase-like deaminating enzyme
VPGPGEECPLVDTERRENTPSVYGANLTGSHGARSGWEHFFVDEHKIVHQSFILKGVIEIVGGGLIGLSCAWELGRRGFETVVYEKDLTRRGSASWAGAGMLGAWSETFPTELWRQRAKESAGLYSAFVQRIGGDIDFVEGSAGQEGYVDPRDLLRELGRQVRVVEREVLSLKELEGQQVIVASGAWWMKHAGLPAVEPVKGYILAWDGFQPGRLKGILRDGHTYLLQRRTGRVIVGSTEERIGFDPVMDSAQIENLRTRAVRLWPELAGRDPSEIWFGFRPAAHGDVPVLERWNPKVVLAYGHYRNGILLAPWTARWVADEVQRQLGK